MRPPKVLNLGDPGADRTARSTQHKQGAAKAKITCAVSIGPRPAERWPLGMAPRARPMPFAYLIAVTVHTEVVASSAFVRSRLNCSSMSDS
jgi:hypothetical protein